MKEVYITKISKYLPNAPVSNDNMEQVLGQINDEPSKARRIVLRNNGIKQRYYALNNEGKVTHNNAELTQGAVERLYDASFSKNNIELLSCGTSTPDQLLPSHAAMVHGLLSNRSVELNSASGVCCAGMSALKYGYMSVRSGNTNNAVCTGSERVSTWMLSSKFDNEVNHLEGLQEQPIIAFKKDFLRWMLSDGAGALLLENKKRENEISLRIDWMDYYSYAHELEACMYAGGEKLEDGSLKPWSEFSPEEWLEQSVFSLKQDVKVLDENILVKGVKSLKAALEKNATKAEGIQYFLPHISSYYFERKLKDLMKKGGVCIAEDKWFTNLRTVGNVGSASIYLMLEELMNSEKLKKGDTVLLSVPESGRFSFAYAHLTVC